LMKGPSYYNPRIHPRRAVARRNVVLDTMLEAGKINEVMRDDAKKAPLILAPKPVFTEDQYPAYMDLVKDHLRRDYDEDDLHSEGLRIFTTFDPQVQAAADKALVQGLVRLEQRYGDTMAEANGAVVVTDVETGDVLAVTGGKETTYSGFNRAMEASRQVGSLAKSAVYLTAIDQGYYELNAQLDDSPVAIELPNGDVWEPKNYDLTNHGTVPLIMALAKSYNQATVRLAEQIGFDEVIKTLGQLGVEVSVPVVPSVSLGSFALTPYEVADMYQTIAAGGFNSPARAIMAVVDAKGALLNRYPMKVTQAFDSESIALLTFGLQTVVKEGTAKSTPSALKALNVAGKTGTTNDQRDSWFAGFSGNTVAVVWVGRDDNGEMPITGASGALPIWSQLMLALPQQPLSLGNPDELVEAWYDPLSTDVYEFQCTASLKPIILRRERVEGELQNCSPAQKVKRWWKNVLE